MINNMKKRLLQCALGLLLFGAGTTGVLAQSTGDIFTYDGHKYKVTGENLITNNSFESNFSGWTSANDYATELSSSKFTLVSSGAQDGTNYLKGTVNEGGQGDGSVGTAWPIEAGKTYVYSYWIKSETGGTGTGYVKSSLTNTKGTETYALGTPTVTSDGSWCQFQKVFTNPETGGYTFCQASFRWLNSQWGFDNFVLAEVTEMPNTEMLETAIAEAEALYSESGEGAAALNEAIQTAKGYLTSASVEEVSQATTDLNAAIFTYKVANTTAGNPLDFTSWVANAGFEQGTETSSLPAFNKPYGWTLQTTAGGWLDGTINTAAPSEGSKLYNLWAGQVTSLDLYQEITGLPSGKYRLEGDLRIDDIALVTNQGVYATVGATTSKSGTITTVAPTWNSLAGWNTLSVEFVVAAEGGTARIGVSSTGSGSNSSGWFQVDNIRLTYLGYDNTAALAVLNDLITQGQALSDGGGILNALWDELDAQILAAQTVVGGTPTKSAIETATSNLSAAIVAAEASKAPLAQLGEAITYNTNVINNSTPTSESAFNNYYAAITSATMTKMTATTAAELEQAYADLETARRAYVLAAYPYVEEGYSEPAVPFDMTFLLADPAVTSASAWTNGRVNSGQQYTGAPDNTYLDMWNQTLNISQVVATLPAGFYRLKAATRAHETVPEAYIYAQGRGAQQTADLWKVGASGNELGNGWGWTTISDIAVDGSLTIGMYGDCSGSTWAGADDFRLELVRAFNELDKLAAAQVLLAEKIAEADAATAHNVGTGAFQRNTDDVDFLKYLVDQARPLVTATIETTTEENVNMWINQIDNNLPYVNTLNAPAADKGYTLVNISDWTDRTGSEYCQNTALTFVEGGRTDQGNYAVEYGRGTNANYAQGFLFTPVTVEGKLNCYKMGMIDADGVMRYLCTGTPYGGNDSQIRTTLNADDAVVWQVVATDAEGVYNFINLNNSKPLSGQDKGAYCDNGPNFQHYSFNIVETAKAEVNLTVTEAGYATVMLPYEAAKPDGLTVYTCAAAADEVEGIRVLTLSSVDKLTANTPYIVAGQGSYAFSGYGTAHKDEYTEGWLTGTYVDKTATVGAYVLQNQATGVGFYPVVSGKEPTIGANRAWMTPDEAAVKGFIIAAGDADAIENVAGAADNATVDVYTLDGVQVRQGVPAGQALKGLRKGLYIVNGVKKAVR